MKKFKLTEDDYFAIEIAKNIARMFLKRPGITPEQIVGLGNALYVLERLPDITPGSFSEFGISYRAGDENFEEMRYIDFTVSEDSFRISIGGSVYSKDVGSDSFSRPGWAIEIGGYREEGCELWALEDDIVEYLNLGAEVVVSDDSDIEVEADNGFESDLNEGMEYLENIISEIAESECNRICRKTIRSLQKMTEGMQSGDDSGLKNIWDEICVQIQFQYSFFWEAYLETIDVTIAYDVEQLDTPLKQAIWLQTQSGMDWTFEEENPDSVPIGECVDWDITDYIRNKFVLKTAADWKNKRIERYLE